MIVFFTINCKQIITSFAKLIKGHLVGEKLFLILCFICLKCTFRVGLHLLNNFDIFASQLLVSWQQLVGALLLL